MQSTPSDQGSQVRRVLTHAEWGILGFNGLLGCVLWADEFSDYQIAGTIPSLLFPFGVGVVALVSIFRLRRTGKDHQWLRWLTCLPSLLGSLPHLLIAVVACIPPFTLGAMFFVAEVTAERPIQEIASPDGSRVANVILRPVGAYGRGWGTVYIRVNHPIFPLVEREIHHVSATRTAREGPMDYIEWQDNHTLWISETDQIVEVGAVRPELPTVVFLIVLIVQLARFMATQGRG